MADTTETTETTDSYEDRHSDEALLCMVKRHKKEGDQHLGEWREDARECYAFRAGDQWNAEDKARLEEMLRVPVVFNRIDPMVEAVAGSEVNNRQQVRYIPRQAGDSGVNEVLTGAADYFRDACDAEDEESDAFMDVVTCGVGVTETFLDFVDNPEGMVITDRRDPLSMRWDPSAKKRNLTDKRWAQREEWQDKTEIQDKWPDKADEIAASSDWSSESEDGKVHDATLAWLYEKDNTGQDSKTGQLRVIHEQWYELETYHTLLDPFTGQVAEMSDEQFKKLQPRLEALRMNLQSVKKQRKRWMQVFVCGDVVLEFGPVACNECSYKFITGRRDRNKNTWYGLVKAMIDPQKWANKFFSQFLHIINTNAKGGLLMEEGATDNLPKFKREWARSDSVTMLNTGGLAKIQPKTPPLIPPQMAQMMEFSISSLRDVSGLNLEILGMANREQAGVLEQQRKQAALTVLASLFDGLRRYRKEQGRLLAKYITEYLSDGRLVRILGGDGTERYIPLLKQQGTLEYDVIVDESATTTNQKDKTFAILMQLLPALEKQGVPFGPELLEYTPLPAAMVQKWKESIEQRKQEQMKNPPPPPPQMISAQANMKRADAAMISATGKAQGDQLKARSDEMKMQGQQMEMMRSAQTQPFEQELQMRELALQERELRVSELEAISSLISAQADARAKSIESLGLRNPG
jgi:hypothetical protein